MALSVILHFGAMKPDNNRDFDDRLDQIEKNQLDIESRLLEQEHRPFSVIKNFFYRDKWEKGDKRRKAVKLAIVWRLFFSPAVMATAGGAIGIVTILILLHQNRILLDQNSKIDYQNVKIIEQNNLIEADRRSAQVFLMSDVLSDLQLVLTDQNRSIDSTIPMIMANRISSVSRAMIPYRPYFGDSLSHFQSPERGQLLISLINSGINQDQLNNEILDRSQGKFDFAQLNDANLSNQNFDRISLMGSLLSRSDLSQSSLRNSLLIDAKLESANLRESNLEMAKLMLAKMRFAELWDAKLSSANLQGAILNYAFLEGSDLRGTILSEADLSHSELINVKFDDARLVDYTEDPKTSVILDSAKVDRIDWIEYIRDTLKLTGAKIIDSIYKVEFKEIDYYNDSIFQIVRKVPK